MANGWSRSKALALAALVSLLTLGTGLLAASVFLTLERYQPRFVDWLGQATGRAVEMGSLELRLLPTVRLLANEIRVGNPPEFPAGYTLMVEEVEIGLALRPLLRRELEITSVTAKGVELNVLENHRGQTNYHSLLAGLERLGSRTLAAGVAGMNLSLVRVGPVALKEVRVSSGQIPPRDQQIQRRWAVRGLNLTARGLDLTQEAGMSALEVLADLSGVEISTVALKPPLRLTRGELKLKGNSARGSSALALGPLRGQGTLQIADLRQPVPEFTLALREFNTTQLGALLAGPQAQRQGAASNPDASRLLARGAVELGRLIAPPLSAENLHAQVRLYADRLEADSFTAELYGGRTHGSLRVDLSRGSLPARMTTRVEGVDLAQLLAAAGARTREKVAGQFEANAGLGLSLGAVEPLAGLSGEGSFAVRDGVFTGLEVEGTLAKIAKLMPIGVLSRQTRFSYFGGDFRISNQRFYSQELLLDAEALEARLQGSLGFDQKLDYTGTSFLKGHGNSSQEANGNPLSNVGRLFGKIVRQTMKITRMEVRFVVRGTLEEPRIILASMPKPTRGRS